MADGTPSEAGGWRADALVRNGVGMNLPECSDCGTPISGKGTTGRCRSCAMRQVGRSNAIEKPPCLNCGKPVPRAGYTYCSRECYEQHRVMPTGADHPSWTDTPTKAALHKRAQRAFAAKECNRCGSIDGLVRHHVDHNPANNVESNIEVLCRSCHAKHHHGKEAA